MSYQGHQFAQELIEGIQSAMSKPCPGKALVTGAAGFIGSHLVDRLIKDRWLVAGLDNFDPFYDRKTKENNISSALQTGRLALIKGDIRNPKLIESILGYGDIDVIVHLAARAGVRPSIQDPVGYQDVNLNGTVQLLEAARKFGIKKFVFASSSSVYGNNEKVPFAEKDRVDDPISPYAATKKAGELICHTYSHLYDMDVTCLRFFTVYGPRQRPDLAIHKFARLIEDGKPIPVYGDGSMQRDFTYIDDIINGIMAAISRCKGYDIYNLGESKPVRLDVLISQIEQALGKKAVIERRPLQPGDVHRTCADIQKAKSKLDYEPGTELSEGLARFIRWFRENRNHAQANRSRSFLSRLAVGLKK